MLRGRRVTDKPMVNAEDLLRFWFGRDLDSPDVVAARCRLWFSAPADFDEEIRARFAGLPGLAGQGLFDGWREKPRSCLALVLALDQLPRNLYRRSRQAFAFDARAVKVAEEALALGFDAAVHPLEAAFFYLPLEHAEDLVLQERAVELFGRLRERAPAGLLPVFQSFFDYAVRHRLVIRRFGRFPHRNVLLGRPSTGEERDYLAAGGETFGG
jgi:uncharacterized protein (DUF924 family)